jgi:hypothetical protein
MTLDTLLAEKISFAAPGVLRTHVVAEGLLKCIGISTMVAQFIVQLSEASERDFTETLAGLGNQFLAEAAGKVESLEPGEVLAAWHGISLEAEHLEFSVKVFQCIKRVGDGLQVYACAVHPEEMDVLLRCALAAGYDALFGPQDQ